MANPYRGGDQTRVQSGTSVRPTARPQGRGIIGSMPHPPDTNPNVPGGGGPGGPAGSGTNQPGGRPGGDTKGVGIRDIVTRADQIIDEPGPSKKPRAPGSGRK